MGLLSALILPHLKHAEVLTAWATATLAAMTFLLAFGTLALVRSTVNGIREERDTSRRQLEATYKPVIVDVPRHGSIYPSMGATVLADQDSRESALELLRISHATVTQDIDPRRVWVNVAQSDDAVPKVLVSVPIRNVGKGLAVIDLASLTLTGQAVGSVTSGTVKPERVPVDETARVEMEFNPAPDVNIDEVIRGGPFAWQLALQYADFVGGQITRSTFDINSVEALDINDPDKWAIGRIALEPV